MNLKNPAHSRCDKVKAKIAHREPWRPAIFSSYFFPPDIWHFKIYFLLFEWSQRRGLFRVFSLSPRWISPAFSDPRAYPAWGGSKLRPGRTEIMSLLWDLNIRLTAVRQGHSSSDAPTPAPLVRGFFYIISRFPAIYMQGLPVLRLRWVRPRRATIGIMPILRRRPPRRCSWRD